uniref:Uncharacterized protein n=1 Tax=Acrobeloides nanus TaxID=290746 RepID=A0A914D6E3_9BILA
MVQKTPPTDEQLSFKAEPIDLKAIAQALNPSTSKPPTEIGFMKKFFNNLQHNDLPTLAPLLPKLYDSNSIAKNGGIINEELLQRLLPRIQGQTLPAPTLPTTESTTTESTTTESTTTETTTEIPTDKPKLPKRQRKKQKGFKNHHKKHHKKNPAVTGWTSPKTAQPDPITTILTTPVTSPTTPSTTPTTTPSTTTPTTTVIITTESTTAESPTTNLHTTKREVIFSTDEDSPPTRASQPQLMVRMKTLDDIRNENLKEVEKFLKAQNEKLDKTNMVPKKILTSSEELEDNIVAELGSKLDK